eukprot:9781861-Alexandrium_andersonii.AAC.1
MSWWTADAAGSCSCVGSREADLLGRRRPDGVGVALGLFVGCDDGGPEAVQLGPGHERVGTFDKVARA